MKFIFITILLPFSVCMYSQSLAKTNHSDNDYLNDIKRALESKWPENKTINLVFHGHSVPAGYFKTPDVKTTSAYPYLVLSAIKSQYPNAVVNVIVTAMGGENSVKGSKRFEKDVLCFSPDVLFIDYGLNDRKVGLDNAHRAWSQMITQATALDIPVILLTPTPDKRVDYSNQNNELKKHANQISALATQHQIGLVDSYKAFAFLYDDKMELNKYMSHVNQPNEKGHALVAKEIMKYFDRSVDE